MVRASWVALVGALAIAGASHAETTKVTFSADSTLGGFSGIDLGYGKGEINGGAYNSFVNVTPGAVTFESANATSFAGQLTSSSRVVLGFTNTDTKPVLPTVQSQITPAGLGFYLADVSNCSPGYGTCAQATGYTFNDLGLEPGEPIRLASYDFSVVADDHTVFSVSGEVDLATSRDGTYGFGSFTDSSFGLTNFGEEVNDGSAFGYNWDATDLNFSMFRTLNPGDSDFIEYQTSVSTYNDGLCVSGTTVCLVAYSGFGDPIGRGGGPDSLSVVRPSFGGLFSHSFDLGPPGIKGLQFSSFDLHPTFVNGVLDTNGGVPEPATWVSMILGFGLLGAVFRRRRGLARA